MLSLVSGLVLAANEVIVGNVRVQALSSTLIRVEPKGPHGFEDRTTFMVESRSTFPGIPIQMKSSSGGKSTLTTDFYTIDIVQAGPGPSSKCHGANNTDLAGAHRISTCAAREKSCVKGFASPAECCSNCSAIAECKSWISDPLFGDCWLMAAGGTPEKRADRVAGGDAISNAGVSVTVTSTSGDVLFQTDDTSLVEQNLIWPAPSANASAFTIKDYPRFFSPPWGPTPIPKDAKVEPGLVATNGYDFTNNVNGDSYIFLLGSGLADWHASRAEFVNLAGPTPALPDFAFGTWFTWWHQYSETEAKGEVERWQTDKLPIDVWALDMNWRQSPHGHNGNFTPGEEHFYTYPNTILFPDFADPGTGWFDWLKSQKIRTYFNDHPFPTDNGTAYQTTKDEVSFRWDGLSRWLERGLTFWWFDANWRFSVPPPNVPYGGTGDGPSWEGMDNRVWGSHLYYTSVKVYGENNPSREHTLPLDRPMVLTKYADGNMHPGLVQHQHPAQHRYPVWWTGDGVDLEASVESMVDSGVYDFKPYVHSDCGGDYRGKVGGDLMRWASHCAFGTIHRFHGSDHRPWSYDNATEDNIRSYLETRYKLLPSLIAAGHSATYSGFPLVARCDIFWPQAEYASAASSNHQYMFLNDTLVAPIWDSSTNLSSRYVWIPPGTWSDAWSGETVTGPKNLSVTQPYERIPMWHRHGGFSVIASEPGLRVDDQDWSELTIEAFPDFALEQPTSFSHFAGADEKNSSSASTSISTSTSTSTQRTLVARGKSARPPRTQLSMTTSAASAGSSAADTKRVRFAISRADDGAARAWVLRVHLRTSQRVTTASVDGRLLSDVELSSLHIAPLQSAGLDFFPFGGKHAAPAPMAGNIAEVQLESGSHPRTVELEIN